MLTRVDINNLRESYQEHIAEAATSRRAKRIAGSIALAFSALAISNNAEHYLPGDSGNGPFVPTVILSAVALRKWDQQRSFERDAAADVERAVKLADPQQNPYAPDAIPQWLVEVLPVKLIESLRVGPKKD
jgi:hypothetical protein